MRGHTSFQVFVSRGHLLGTLQLCCRWKIISRSHSDSDQLFIMFTTEPLLCALQSLTVQVSRFLPRGANAERGDATVSRLSVCPSVCP